MNTRRLLRLRSGEKLEFFYRKWKEGVEKGGTVRFGPIGLSHRQKEQKNTYGNNGVW